MKSSLIFSLLLMSLTWTSLAQTNTFPVSGNVGIGTMSPAHKLHVVGSGRFNGTASSYTEINSNSSGAYIWQYNAAGNLSWVIRGYGGPVQAEFRHGGIKANGKVTAKEVNVTATGWPDYVFKPEYKLMPLSKVANYIQENGHLPNIPTEAEVMENGVNLAEMNVKLLEKVEELTLYVIEQNSQIEALKAELKSIQKK